MSIMGGNAGEHADSSITNHLEKIALSREASEEFFCASEMHRRRKIAEQRREK